uniref:Uncharacterized protein n=1 Tax=Streptomyces sp. FR1 TaxID=349971 RepID=I1VH48_9ACTN|nr:hypothetical protein [Streptomyces sp. FR1]AFI44046.1 hypothetical protein pFP4.47 [Streptomyces sp. FR1]
MNQLPDPQQPTAGAAGQPALEDQARAFLDAIEDAMRTPTSYRDETPVPPIGSALPVPQPGRPPMSQKATDASALMLSAGVASLPLGAAVTGILWASGTADPAVVGMICGAPAALILALSRLVRGVKQAAPDVHHHHYEGDVHQDHRTYTTETRGVWAHTRNQLPK